MQMKVDSKIWYGGVALLIGLAACVRLLLYRVPPDIAKGLGTCFLAIGAMNILFHRRIGKQIYAQAQSMRPVVSKVWEGLGGQRGAQILYLGIGIVFAFAGCALLIVAVLAAPLKRF